MPAPDFSILIPLYNEQESLIRNIGRLLRFLESQGLNAEILLGSNGSTDATAPIGRMLQEAFPGKIRFFQIDGRALVGEVFVRAAEMASSPILISIDADLPIDLEFIPGALKLLGENDIVVGSKLSGSQERSFHRILASRFYIACARVLLGLPYDDYSIGAKAYIIEPVRPLLGEIANDTNYVLDLLLAARRRGLSITVLSVACSDLRSSRFRLFREGLVRFSHLFRVWVGGLARG